MASEKGCFFRLLKILLILLILLVVAAVSLFFLATGAPISYPAPQFDAADTGVVANIITRLARSLVDKDGRVVDTAVLKLSQNEVQTLLNAAVRSSNRNDFESLPYAAQWVDGHLRARGSLPFSSTRAVNLDIEFSPVVDRGDLTLNPARGTIGRLPLPRFGLDYVAKELTHVAMGNESIRTTLSAFTRIEPGEDGMLVLMFDPRDVNTVVRILRSAGKDPSAVEDEDDEDDEDEDEYDDYEDEEFEEDREEEDEYGEDSAEGTGGTDQDDADRTESESVF